MYLSKRFCTIQYHTFMYAQVEPLKENPVKRKKKRQGKKMNKEDEVINNFI